MFNGIQDGPNTESRQDHEEGGELDSHKEVKTILRVQARSRGGRWCWTQVSPEEIKGREVELGSESWTSFASVVTQQQCYRHCL